MPLSHQVILRSDLYISATARLQMNMLQNAFQSDPQTALTLSGLFIGIAFGVLAGRTNFCVMGAVADWRASGSRNRIGAVALAAAVAILGAQTLDYMSLTSLSRSIYLSPQLNWLGALAGGLLFGSGMVYAGGCASRNLVRAGSGDLRSAVTLLILAVAAFAAMSGVLGPLRAVLESATALPLGQFGFATQSLNEMLAALGIPAANSHWLAPLLVAGPLTAFSLMQCKTGHDKMSLIGGTCVGILVVAGWLATGLAYNEMDVNPSKPTSLSFVRPVADTVDWIARATALGLPGFGAATVFGTLIGSGLEALSRGSFRIQGFANNDDMLRHIGGALAMGVGGVLALGCSIGQGITGVSTLSVQSIIAAASILAGAVMALRRLEHQL